MLLVMQKEKLVNVRLTPKTHDEFKIACELRGASMSSLLHQFIVRTIREERDLTPSAFSPGYRQVPKWSPDVKSSTEKPLNGNLEPIPDDQVPFEARSMGKTSPDQPAKITRRKKNK